MGLDRALDLCGKPSLCFFALFSDSRPTFGRNKHDSPMILLPSRCREIPVSDMEATSIFLASRPRPIPITCPPPTRKSSSLGHSIKQLHHRRTTVLAYKSINLSLQLAEPRPFPLPRCSLSGAMNPSSQPGLLQPFNNLSFDWLKQKVSRLTPLDIVKVSGILSVSIAATRWAVNLALNPFFWMYFSWSWLFWPWIVAVLVAVSGLYCLRKHLQGKASIFEQLVVVTSVFTWLTLVPPAHFNGFLQGWPFVFFFVYHYFFFFNVSIRRRMYGDYYARPHDPKWDVDTPGWQRLLFCLAVMVGHWLAAFEGPELHRIPGGWSNLGIWLLILATFLTQYNSSLYLAKYSEKIVVPTSVVQYGPYRWVRHPIYASTMLLFATYCAALRAPLSLLFVVGACVLYYEQKIRLEEALMIETFGEGYLEYGRKVKHKLIPFVY